MPFRCYKDLITANFKITNRINYGEARKLEKWTYGTWDRRGRRDTLGTIRPVSSLLRSNLAQYALLYSCSILVVLIVDPNRVPMIQERSSNRHDHRSPSPYENGRRDNGGRTCSSILSAKPCFFPQQSSSLLSERPTHLPNKPPTIFLNYISKEDLQTTPENFVSNINLHDILIYQS